MTQDDHFALVFRKTLEHLANAVMTLSFHHGSLCAFVSEVEYFKNIFVLPVADSGSAFYFTEVVNTEVMRNTHSPGKEFSFFCVAAAAHRVNDADKHILEDVFGQIFVFYQEQDRRVEFILMTQHQGFQGVQISIYKQMD